MNAIAKQIALPEVGTPNEEARLKEVIEELEVQEALEAITEQEAPMLAQARLALQNLFEREREDIVG